MERTSLVRADVRAATKPRGRLQWLHASTLMFLAIWALLTSGHAVWGDTGQLASGSGSQTASGSFIRPLNRKRAYRLVVIGDSVGANLADGLKWTFRRGDNIVVRKRTKAGTGFVRSDVYDWQRVIRRLSRRGKADIIVILIGGNDRQDMRARGRRFVRFSKNWRKEYSKRLDRAARTLKSSGAAVYWVGLPNVRSSRMTRDYADFNRLFRRISRRHGFRYIGIRKLFETRSGGYSDYGRDLKGRRARLRDRDGIHMSTSGSKVLGRFVADHVLSDMPGRKTLTAKTTDGTTFARKRVSQ